MTRDGREYDDRLPLDEQFIMLSMMEDIPEGWYRLAQRNRPAIPAGLRHDPRDDDTSAVFRLVYGPSLTVSMVSGDAEVAGDALSAVWTLCGKHGGKRGCSGLPAIRRAHGGVSRN